MTAMTKATREAIRADLPPQLARAVEQFARACHQAWGHRFTYTPQDWDADGELALESDPSCAVQVSPYAPQWLSVTVWHEDRQAVEYSPSTSNVTQLVAYWQQALGLVTA